MSDGTIDLGGFRADLASIAQNDYPKLGLLKLPFNWYAPASGGIIATGMGLVSTGGLLIDLQEGAFVLVFVHTSNTGATAPVVTVTDTQGNVYTQAAQAWEAFFGDSGTLFECASAIGGTATITAASVGAIARSVTVVVIEGAIGVTAVDVGMGSVSSTAYAGNLVLTWCGASSDSTSTDWTEDSGYTLVLDNTPPSPVTAQYLSMQTALSSGAIDQTIAITGWTGNALPNILISIGLEPPAPIPAAPITPITLPGPCNFFALVSEAIDEQGTYQQSALIGQQSAAGFIRMNGQGNVWIPVSFADPMTPGYVTTNDNYAGTPIAGTGFSALEAPFHKLDWRPASPTFYKVSPINIFNLGAAVLGFGIQTATGIPVGASMIGYVPIVVNGATQIIVNFAIGQGSGFSPGLFDAMGNFMGTVTSGIWTDGSLNTNISAGEAMVIPPGVAYILANFFITDITGIASTWMASPGSALPPEYVPYGYVTPVPNAPAGYLLAFAGVNLGVGAGIGLGSGDTYGIPSAAGPVERLRKAGVL